MPYTVYTSAEPVEGQDCGQDCQKFLENYLLSKNAATNIEKWISQMGRESACME